MSAEINPPKLLTVEEVAERLGVTRFHIHRLITAGELPAVHVGHSGAQRGTAGHVGGRGESSQRHWMSSCVRARKKSKRRDRKETNPGSAAPCESDGEQRVCCKRNLRRVELRPAGVFYALRGGFQPKRVSDPSA